MFNKEILQIMIKLVINGGNIESSLKMKKLGQCIEDMTHRHYAQSP